MIYCVAVTTRQNHTELVNYSPNGLVISRSRLYLLEFENEIERELAENAARKVANTLFSDPVIEEANIGPAEALLKSLNETSEAFALLTAYRPGVTDTTGESVFIGYRVLAEHETGLPPLKRVRTADLYLLKENNPAYVRQHLINELIQESVALTGDVGKFLDHQFHFEHSAKGLARIIPIREVEEAELERISRDGLLALSLAEMQAIQAFFRQEQRDPTDVELETLAQTWSEHCVHKTFKARVTYTETDHTGEVAEEHIIDGLFKEGIAAPTHQMNKKWIISAFVDNAGIISFDRHHDLSFKAETHNHPSALEPFGGANTGLGGVIRDIMAVSAKPIANTDVFCFGMPDTDPATLPTDVLPPQRVFDGVVGGVRDYGNKMGIPTVNGAILFDLGYVANPLVFCGTVGIAPHGSHPSNLQPGDLVVVVGGRTGRDGIHGATFSSIELGGEQVAAEAGSVVQIGNPIVEKKTLDLILKARDLKLYSAITDCGGGGLSSAVGEMGKETGVRVELEKIPLKYAGLEPWEIWLSEAQERMLLAIHPANLDKFMELCKLEDVEATVVGEFTNDKTLTLNYAGNTVGSLKMDFLHDGLPRRELSARWQRRAIRPRNLRAHYEHHRPYQGYENVLLKILADPNIASKEQVIRLYDHEVQGGTVVKPLVGQANDGPSDAAVIRPLPDSKRGVVISNGINPRYSLIDPYHMAACAIDEAVRNAVAVGADIKHMALLDNFCWGNPNVPERLGELTRAVMACRDYALAFSLPFISGKDSLNNEYKDPATGKRIAIPGTLLVSAIAIIEDVERAVTMDLKQPGNLIYILGRTRPELGASYYSKLHGLIDGEVPKVEAGSALRNFRALSKAIHEGLVSSCHDLSEGGLAVAAAEMAIAGGYGMRLDLLHLPYSGLRRDRTNAAILFSETPSRFLIEVEPDKKEAFEAAMHGTIFARIGVVLEDDEFSITGLSSATMLRLHIGALKAAWKEPLFAR